MMILVAMIYHLLSKHNSWWFMCIYLIEKHDKSHEEELVMGDEAMVNIGWIVFSHVMGEIMSTVTLDAPETCLVSFEVIWNYLHHC